jgi:hypothetical protein
MEFIFPALGVLFSIWFFIFRTHKTREDVGLTTKKKCPECLSLIPKEAKKCMRCASVQPALEIQKPVVQEPIPTPPLTEEEIQAQAYHDYETKRTFLIIVLIIVAAVVIRLIWVTIENLQTFISFN